MQRSFAPFFILTRAMDNIDPSELAKFEALASRWWDPQSEFAPLHQINPLRVDFIKNRAPLKGARVLDVGCGGGILSEALSRLGAHVTGMDAGAAPIGVARLHAKLNDLSIDYRHQTVEQLADEEPAAYDIICCLEMLEHVPDPSKTIGACSAVLKPGGNIFFSTINRNIKSFLFAIVGAEYVLSLLPKGTHDYRKLIRPSELDEWSRRENLQLKEITGMHYNPLLKRYRLGEGVAVNYLAHYRKPDLA
ncbi:MAG: bifunctional 2-polyprenyl-6-hydroxyphenol methylase/3-demethylubiquinol 3-O-methyltransferase UbiG [Gammaproteobacteria bacterium]